MITPISSPSAPNSSTISPKCLSVWQAMDQLLQKMYNADIQLFQGNERVGIINACLRLKMQTNNEVLFELDGEEGIGLMVQIKIPCKYLTQEAAVC